MPDLDALLDPEKLRDRWKEEKKAPVAVSPFKATLSELKQWVEAQLPGQIELFRPFFNEMDDIFLQMQEEDTEKERSRMLFLLNQVEDFLDAFLLTPK